MQIKWYSKLIYRILLYAPVFVLWTQIMLIYSVYMINYILVLINPANDPVLHSKLYIAAHMPSYSAGFGLFIIINWCVIMMIISMFRTTFMDPGYVPNPMKLEFKLIQKNLEYSYHEREAPAKKISRRNLKENSLSSVDNTNSDEFSPILECNSSASYVNINEDSVERLNSGQATNEFAASAVNDNNHNANPNSKRYKFIREFDKFISDGPLTSTEFIKYRCNLEKYLNTHQMANTTLEIQNISQNDKYSINYYDIYENFRNVDFSKLNFCATCLRWKVERSHHCKQCGKCVLKMDHHCPWLANCIGFRNYKFFCLTIIYSFCVTLIIFFTFWEVVVEVNLNYNSSLFLCCLYTFTYISNFGMLCFLTWLFNTNWGLLFSNQTTIERSDKQRFATSGIRSFNYYDQGSFRNFTSVFGRNPLFWFIPVFPNYKGEGIIFDS